MFKKYRFILLFLVVQGLMFISPSQILSQTKLLIRCDDTGMCHTVNMAVKKLIEAGIPFSTSVMFACPWYQEAVDILKDHPKSVSVGVHLTLNSEWKNYKWGPISGKLVPSLVDSNGYFYTSEEDFINSNFKLSEVEIELRAQIERALACGLKIDYLDHHMGTAASTPELRSLMEKLAMEYQLGISTYFSENYNTLWEISPEKKLPRLLQIMNHLDKDKTNLIVIHLGMDNPEMEALIDLNYLQDPYRVSKHRQAELEAVTCKAFDNAINKNKIILLTYRDLITDKGLETMIRPTDGASFYMK
jgi:predicted glycoside hydrolase/deacetylase ChbG (UPF0249 family)